MNFLFQVDIILSKDGAWEENKLLVNKKTDNGSFSIIIALSQFRFLGMMVIDKTVRASEIIKFLSSLKTILQSRENADSKFVVICD